MLLQKKSKKDEANIGKRISQSTSDVYGVLDGVGRNMRKMKVGSGPNEIGSSLLHLHIVNIKVNVHAWKSMAKGLMSESCVLKKFKVNLVEFDRDGLTALAEGLSVNISVNQIDLSHNNLKDAFGDILARIVSK